MTVAQQLADGGVVLRETVPSSDVVRARFGDVDGLRALAVVAIVAFQTVRFIGLPARTPPAVAQLFGDASQGFALFLLLSAFSLAYPILAARRTDGATYLDVGRYAVKRLLRIYPAFLAVLGVGFATHPLAVAFHWTALAHAVPAIPVSSILPNAVFLDGGFGGFANGAGNDGFTGLALVARGFILLPPALIAWLRAPRTTVAAAVLAAALDVLTPAHAFTLSAVLPLVLGIVAADLRVQHHRLARFGLPLALGAAVAAFFVEPYLALMAGTVAAPDALRVDPFWSIASFGLLVAAGFSGRLETLLGFPPLRLLGSAAYGISLVAMPVAALATQMLPERLSFGALAASTAAEEIGAGMVVWLAVDRWFARDGLRRHVADRPGAWLDGILAPWHASRLVFAAPAPAAAEEPEPVELRVVPPPAAFYAPPPRPATDIPVFSTRTGSADDLAAEILQTKARLGELSAAVLDPEPRPAPPDADPYAKPGFYRRPPAPVASSGRVTATAAAPAVAVSRVAPLPVAPPPVAPPPVAPTVVAPQVAVSPVDSPGLDSPGLDSPGLNSPGVDSPGIDSPGVDSPGVDSPGADWTGVVPAVVVPAVVVPAVAASLVDSPESAAALGASSAPVEASVDRGAPTFSPELPIAPAEARAEVTALDTGDSPAPTSPPADTEHADLHRLPLSLPLDASIARIADVTPTPTLASFEAVSSPALADVIAANADAASAIADAAPQRAPGDGRDHRSDPAPSTPSTPAIAAGDAGSGAAGPEPAPPSIAARAAGTRPLAPHPAAAVSADPFGAVEPALPVPHAASVAEPPADGPAAPEQPFFSPYDGESPLEMLRAAYPPIDEPPAPGPAKTDGNPTPRFVALPIAAEPSADHPGPSPETTPSSFAATPQPAGEPMPDVEARLRDAGSASEPATVLAAPDDRTAHEIDPAEGPVSLVALAPAIPPPPAITPNRQAGDVFRPVVKASLLVRVFKHARAKFKPAAAGMQDVPASPGISTGSQGATAGHDASAAAFGIVESPATRPVVTTNGPARATAPVHVAPPPGRPSIRMRIGPAPRVSPRPDGNDG